MLKIPKVEKKSKNIGRDEQVYNQVHTDEQVYNQVHTGLNELLGSLNCSTTNVEDTKGERKRKKGQKPRMN